VIEHPHYYKIRNHVIHFLVRHASHDASEGVGGAPEEKHAPVVVRF
jgi:nitrate/nitrite transport system ATP-binding protein